MKRTEKNGNEPKNGEKNEKNIEELRKQERMPKKIYLKKVAYKLKTHT